MRHLGQQLAKAAPLGGQFAHAGARGSWEKWGPGSPACAIGARLHAGNEATALERHCWRKQQVEGMGGVQLGIKRAAAGSRGRLAPACEPAMEQTSSKQNASAGLISRRGSLCGLLRGASQLPLGRRRGQQGQGMGLNLPCSQAG